MISQLELSFDFMGHFKPTTGNCNCLNAAEIQPIGLVEVVMQISSLSLMYDAHFSSFSRVLHFSVT